MGWYGFPNDEMMVGYGLLWVGIGWYRLVWIGKSWYVWVVVRMGSCPYG